jgi:hypothetical protein
MFSNVFVTNDANVLVVNDPNRFLMNDRNLRVVNDPRLFVANETEENCRDMLQYSRVCKFAEIRMVVFPGLVAMICDFLRNNVSTLTCFTLFLMPGWGVESLSGVRFSTMFIGRVITQMS